MLKATIDFCRVQPRHKDIDNTLNEWSQWVMPRHRLWGTSPMFLGYQSKARQWETPELKTPLNVLQCVETEKAVSTLPEKHRTALRWVYVYYWVPVSAVRRELGVTKADLADLIDQARDMISNKLGRKA